MTQIFLPDSSVMVPAISRWHPRKAAARAAIEQWLQEDNQMVVAGHAVTETYSVLTRVPPQFRLDPVETMDLIRIDFLERATVAALPGADYVTALMSFAERGIAGGRIYDAIIATTAIVAGASVLLTFNERDFAGLVPGLEIVVPGV